MKVGPEETPKLPYLRFASVTLHPSNEDLSLAIGAVLRSLGLPPTSIICAKAECEPPPSPSTPTSCWHCAVSSVTPPPSGLLRLEELVQSFLISRETLSVRMLDQSLDPTPLLKEVRDDQVATIIIHANASLSLRILKKVSTPPADLIVPMETR